MIRALKKKGEEITRQFGHSLYGVAYVNDSVYLVLKKTGLYVVGKTTSAIDIPAFPDNYHFMNVEPGRSYVCFDQVNFTGFFFDILEKKDYPIKLLHPAITINSVVGHDAINSSNHLLVGKKLYKMLFTRKGIDLELVADLPEVPSNVSSISVYPKANQIFIGSLYDGVYIYTRSFFHTYQFNDPSKYNGKKNLLSFPPINNLYTTLLINSSQLYFTHFYPPSSQGVIVNLDNGSFDFAPVRDVNAFVGTIDRHRTIYFQAVNLLTYSLTSKGWQGPHTFGNTYPVGLYYDSKTDKVWVCDHAKNILGYVEGDSLHEYLPYSEADYGDFNSIKRSNGILLVYSPRWLFRVDEVNKKLYKIYDFLEPSLRDVFIDKDNYVWITTYGKGIYMYDLNTNKIYHPRTDSKEYMLFSHCVVDDGYGNFFVPTNNGLFRINRKALIDACKDSTKTVFYHYYDKSSGLLQNEFNGGCLPAYNKLPNGDILLPSIKGLVRVFTSTISTPDSYPIFIQKIATPKKSYDFKDNMVFGANERILTWEVNFAQWEYPSTSGLSYQADGDSTWTYLNAEERRIQLIDLSGGKHQLRIRNQFDLIGAKISTLVVNFEIKKKYFEKVWFWFFVMSILFLIIYFTAAIRNRQLKRKNIQLERSINKKTLEIRGKNADLEHTLSNLNAALGHLEQNSRFQQKLIGLLGHDIMIPLQYIAKVATQLDNYRHKLSAETTSGAIHEIGTTATQLLYLGESIIHWIKLQEGNFIPRYSKINLYTLVHELVNLHQPLASDKKNIIKNEVFEDFYCVQEPLIIKIILHNLLLNANKFTSNGIITITAQSINDTLNLSVKDTGVGMDNTIVEELNNLKTVSSQKGTANETGWGLGYRFIIDLLKFVHGKFSIQSTKGKGTTVTIDIDLKNIVESEEI